MPQILVVIGAGSIGQAIARRVGAGKHVLLADLNTGNAEAAAKTLDNAGFTVSTATVDVSSRASVEALAQKAAALGEVWGLIPRRRRFAVPGVTGNHPQGRSLRHRAGAGSFR
jgi:NAD(P)-dependent dehydrogenase (short-subunit alcohol dehydrogenase family)